MSTILLNSLNVSKSYTNTTTTQVSGLTTLDGSIDDTTTTISLTTTSQTITSGGTILIDNEYITYSGISNNQLLGVARGAFFSTPTSHSSGASVYGVFVGQGDLNPQPNVACSMSCDTNGTLYFQYSNDGITYDQFPTNGFNVAANIIEFQSGVKLLRYFRIIFKNLSSNKTTTFNSNVYYGSFGQPQLPLNQNISDDYTSTLVRSVNAGQGPTNNFDNIRSDGPAFITNTNLNGTTLNLEFSSNYTGSISVMSTTGFPNSGYIYIDTEFLSYSSIIDASSINVSGRGLFNSNPSSHLSGAIVGEIYNSDIISLTGYTQVATKYISSTTGYLSFQWYSDALGTKLIRTITANYTTTNAYDFLSAPNFGPYVRYIFANTQPSATNNFFFSTDFYTKSVSGQILTLNSTISSAMTSNLSRAVTVGQDPNSSYVNFKGDGYAFQTTTTLSSGQTFSSSVYSTSGFSQIQSEIYSDVSGILIGTWYTESTGTTSPIRTFTRPYDSSQNYAYISSPVFGPYVKYTYTTYGNQSIFYLGLKFLTKAISGQIVNLNDFVGSSMVANLGRNVLVGETDGGKFVNVPVRNQGHLEVAIQDPINPFYSLHTESYTPLSQNQSVYPYSTSTDPSLNPLTYVSYTIGGAITKVYNNMITAQTATTTAYNSARVSDRKISSYSPGQGLTARFTGVFDSSANNVNQRIGISNGQDTLAFGYNGISSEFGIIYESFGVLPVWSFTVNTILLNASATIILNGVPTIITLSTTSTTEAAYLLSRGNFNGWTTYVLGSTVYLQYFQPITTTTCTVTGTNITFSVPNNQIQAVEPVKKFIPQSEWNLDKVNGTGNSGFNLNPQKGNVYEIGVQYLGFGTFTFKVEAPSLKSNDTLLVSCNIINNPNSLIKPTLSIPSFNFICDIDSSGNLSSRKVSTGSFGIFCEGIKNYFGNTYNHTRIVTAGAAIVATLIPIYSIQNNLNFNNKLNKKTIAILSIRLGIRLDAANSLGISNLYIYKNAQISGTNTNFQLFNQSYSCSSYDIGATSYNNGVPTNEKLLYSYCMVDNDSLSINFAQNELNIYPGEILSFGINHNGNGNIARYGLSINTREDD